jgi:hypothetical protein
MFAEAKVTISQIFKFPKNEYIGGKAQCKNVNFVAEMQIIIIHIEYAGRAQTELHFKL